MFALKPINQHANIIIEGRYNSYFLKYSNKYPILLLANSKNIIYFMEYLLVWKYPFNTILLQLFLVISMLDTRRNG